MAKLGDQPTCWIEVDGAQGETDLALRFIIRGFERWIPKSQIGPMKRDESGKIVKFEIARWLAEKEGFAPPKKRSLL